MSKADQAAHSDEIASLTKESGSLQAEVGKISSSPEYSAYKSAVAGLAAAGADYNSLVPLALTLGALDNAAVQISSGQAQLDSQRAELKGRESDTAKQIADARQQLSDARAQLGSAKKEYNGRLSELGASKSLLAENQRKYEDAKAKADKEIAEGEQKIADAQSKISDIKAPEWKVYSREDNISYASIKANIDKVNAIAKIFPFFFFLVAALVASTTMERCKDVIPDCFRFVRGVVDSPDFSLNISREVLQHNRQLRIISTNLEKKVKNELRRLMDEEPEAYEKFYNAFSLQLKYGCVANYGEKKDLLSDLLMYYSSKEKDLVPLREYKSKMPEEQKLIYYVCTDSIDSAEKLPQAEKVRNKGFEILYMFLTGTDEHGQKIEEKARAKGVTPKQFVDDIVEGKGGILDLWKLM